MIFEYPTYLPPVSHRKISIVMFGASPQSSSDSATIVSARESRSYETQFILIDNIHDVGSDASVRSSFTLVGIINLRRSGYSGKCSQEKQSCVSDTQQFHFHGALPVIWTHAKPKKGRKAYPQRL